MKKTVSAVLCAAVCLTSFSFLFAKSTEASLYRKGDVNKDGVVNMMDSAALKHAILGDTDAYDFVSADVDSNGTVNSKDSYYLKLSLVGGASLDDGSLWGGFKIAGNPVSEYEIIVSDTDNPNMVFAAEELQKYVREGDGSELGVVTEPTGARRILLLSDTTGEMGTDGFDLTVENGDLIITAAPKRGNMYAVYTLLQDYWGWRFYGYSDSELLRDKESDIPEGTNDTARPSVRYRCNCIDPFHDAYTYDSVIKNRLSGCTGQPSMHNAKYGFGIERLLCNAHSFDVFMPWNEMKNAKPNTRCLNSASNMAFEVCLKHMLDLIESRVAAGGVIGDSITEISCSFAADDEYCSCTKCRPIYALEGSHSGSLVRFVNRIDDAIHEVYPDITVITNAYSGIRKPPKVTALNDDVVLLYCWNACSNHEISSDKCQETGRYDDKGSCKIEKSYLEGWSEKCKHIYIWYYPTNIYYLLCPQPNFFKLYENFQWFTSHGIEGFYVVGTSGSSFEDLDAYLINNLMWDTDMTKDEYLNSICEYLKYYYGYGWTYIYEYMEMLEECGYEMGCVLNDADHPFSVYSKEYFALHFDEMLELFDKAAAAADNDRERKNIERLSVHMKFLGYSATYDSAYVNGDGASRAAWTEGFKAVYDYINANRIRISYNKTGISAEFTTDVSPMQLVYGFDD